MRKQSNLMLRGGVYYLRIAVPKRIQALRAELGQRSNKDIWKSLGTGDLRAARAAMALALAEVVRGFEEEETRFRGRPVPSLDQLRQVADEFGTLVRTSLANERLLTLPSAAEVEAAESEMAHLAEKMDSTGDARVWEALCSRYFEVAWIPLAHEDQQQAREVLCDRLSHCLDTLDYRPVDAFVRQAARIRGYRLDPDSIPYRQLSHLTLKAWISCLQDAARRFLDTDEGLTDQDQALAAWNSPAVQAPTFKATSDVRPSSIPENRDIRVLFGRYISEKFPRLSRGARQDKDRTLQQFVEVAGLKDPGRYRKTDVTAYKNLLVKLPVNAGRDFAGMTMLEVIATAPVGTKTLAAKTVRSRLSILGSFGRWLSENEDGIDAANFRTSAPSAKKPESPVKEFDDSEIRAIFHSVPYSGCSSERNQLVPGQYKIRDFRYWLPLLAAFTGCRLNELAQLQVTDISDAGPIPTIRITDAGEDQSLKTKASARLVPIHSELMAAGLMQYVNQVRSAGHTALFFDIPVGRNGRRSEAAGKWFRKFIARLGIKNGRGGMHRFRHTVVQKLREKQHSDVDIALIVGHQTGVAPMTAGYGSTKAVLLKSQQAILESLSYEELQLPSLRDRKELAA